MAALPRLVPANRFALPGLFALVVMLASRPQATAADTGSAGAGRSSATPSATAKTDSAVVAKCEADLQYGTPEARLAAITKLTTIEGPLVSEALTRFLGQFAMTIQNTRAERQRQPSNDERFMVEQAINYFAEKPRPTVPRLEESIAGVIGIGHRTGQGVVGDIHATPIQLAPRDLYYGNQGATLVPIKLATKALVNIDSREADKLLVAIAGNLGEVAPLDAVPVVRGNADPLWPGDQERPGSFAVAASYDCLWSILSWCRSEGSACSLERRDALIVPILWGFYHGCREEEDPMKFLFTVLYQGRETRDVAGAQAVAESLLTDAFNRKVDVDGLGREHRAKYSEGRHWHSCGPSDSSPISFGSILPVVGYLAECHSSVLREYGPKLAIEYPADFMLACDLARVGEMSMRATLHQELRSQDYYRRLGTAEAMVEGGALNEEDLAILRYMAENDPEPEIRELLNARLPK